MRKIINLSGLLTFLLLIIFSVACKNNTEKVKLSEKGELLTSIKWKLDPNATLKGITDEVKDTSGIVADVELKGDVKKIVDFMSETVIFGIDDDDHSKLSYSRTIGEGFLSSKVVGYWDFSPDETKIILREWDDEKNAEKDPVEYQIVELSKDKLVILKNGDASPNIYFPKN